MFKRIIAAQVAAAVFAFVAIPSTVGAAEVLHHTGKVGPGLILPQMDPARGRILFASKGCVVCHSVNGIGGKDAPAFDARKMSPAMDPFEFAAKMWAGAGPMIAMQSAELGAQIKFTGQELADIIAFIHNQDEQRKFSEDDIPPPIRKLMK